MLSFLGILHIFKKETCFAVTSDEEIYLYPFVAHFQFTKVTFDTQQKGSGRGIEILNQGTVCSLNIASSNFIYAFLLKYVIFGLSSTVTVVELKFKRNGHLSSSALHLGQICDSSASDLHIG